MKRKSIGAIVFVGVFLCVLVALAMAAQDKYTLKVPNGLSFSEFRGYEAWQVVSISQGGSHMAAILANPVMSRPTWPAFPATASLSPTAQRWRRSIGTSKR